jgi:hypothetical protein
MNAVTVTSDGSVHVVNEFLLPQLRLRDLNLALPPSGSNNMEQQHILLGSR